MMGERTRQGIGLALSLGGLAFAVIALVFSFTSQGDGEQDDRIKACVTEMRSERLGHAEEQDSACESLSRDQQREAAYRWARETGAL